MKLTVLAFLMIFACAVANAQTLPKIIDSSAVTIITKVPFEGKNYFITIVPFDTSNIDSMPMFDPSRSTSKPLVWKDSLGRLLPPSVTDYIKQLEQLKLKDKKPQR